MSTRDFPSRPQPSTADSYNFLQWLDALSQRQNIDLQQELTSVASGDEIGIFDVSETGQVKFKKATVSNIGAAVLAAGGSPTFANLTVTGLLDISGASAGQIKFPATQNPSSNANTLDDYEEGTWTPSVGGTATYGAGNLGTYTKIGGACQIAMQLQINAIGTGSTSTVSGLPFTALTGGAGFSIITACYWANLTTNIYNLVGAVTAGASTIRNAYTSAAVAGMPIDGALLTSSSNWYGQGIYAAN